MSLGLLFSGQGSQQAAMLPWLLGPAGAPMPQPLLENALGPDWRVRLDDPAWRRRNAVAQVLITGLALAAWHALQADLPAPVAIAGYSVGELAACAAAGVLTAPQAMDLAATRARLMDRAVTGLDTGLLSVDGLGPAELQTLCQRHDLVPALLLGPQRCIVGGLRADLVAAAQHAEQAGARSQILAIDIASHTPWLRSAVAPWRAALEATELQPARCVLVCNRDAGVRRDPTGLRKALAEQIAHPVPWDRCLDALAERGVRCVLEIGPGDALSRMWTARHPQVPARSIDQFQHRQGVLDWVRRNLAA
jgi:[acyl-carrier-protein] S-malonyltransferase